MRHPPERPLVITRDTAEPHEHTREGRPFVERCKVCGGLASCEPVFVPRTFAPGIPRGTPYADWPRVDVPTVRGNLDVGDYSLPGLEGMVALERKSGPDLLATLFGEVEDSVGAGRANRDRFRAELERAYAQHYQLFAIVTEVSTGWLFTEAARRFERYGKCFDPPNVLAILRSFAVDLGCPTIWAGSKGMAELEVGSTLARVWSQATSGEKARDARKRGYPIPWIDALVEATSDLGATG